MQRVRTIETLPAQARPPAMSSAARRYLDAELRPNRSLPNAGFWALMGAVIVIGVIASVFYFFMGAWPVIGFFGLDLLLIWLAFRLNYRAGRLMERVTVTADRLEVQRVHPTGHVQHWALAPLWTRVQIERPVDHESQVRVTTGGKTLILGSFLSPDERGDFADALTKALDAARAERFDEQAESHDDR